MSSKELSLKEKNLLIETMRGWGIWHRVVKKYLLKKDEYVSTAVVLLPNGDLENSYYALLYLDRMLRRRNLKSAVLLTTDTIIGEVSEFFSDKIRGIEYITEAESKAILQYYNLSPFDLRFVAASISEPHGRNGELLNGVFGITKEELVAIGVYAIIPYVQMERPIYTGNDEKLISFMSIGGENKHKYTTRKIR